jgi:hypothetical protein
VVLDLQTLLELLVLGVAGVAGVADVTMTNSIHYASIEISRSTAA